MGEGHKSTLPQPIEFPVIRSAYCDQETTNRVIAYLAAQTPDLIAQLTEEEKQPFPESRGARFREICYSIGAHIREAESRDVELPETRLALVDLLYELSRRIRKAQGLNEIPMLGKALAPSPQGPFPQLPVGSAQKLVDKLCTQIYEADRAHV